jgi:hypothetical protein
VILIAATDGHWTKDERISFYLSGLIAVDPDTGAEMDASGGQRKRGRGRRYSVSLPTGETRMGYLGTNNPRPIPVKRRAFSVTAYTEADAIERANKALTRFLSKQPVWSLEEWNWVFNPPAPETK